MRLFTWAAQAVSTVAVSTAPIAVTTSTTAVTTAPISITTSAAGMFRFTGSFCGRWCMLNRVASNFAVIIRCCGLGHVMWAVVFCSQVVVVTVNVFQCSCSATSYKCLHDLHLSAVFVRSSRYAPKSSRLHLGALFPSVIQQTCSKYLSPTLCMLRIPHNYASWFRQHNTMKPAYNGTRRDQILFRCRQVPFLTGTWSMGPWDCKRFALNIVLHYIQVPFKTGFAVFVKMCQLRRRNNNTTNIAIYEGRTESHEQLFCMRTGNSRRRRVRW